MKPLLFVALLLAGITCPAQGSIDSLLKKLQPEKWSASMETKLRKLEERITRKTTKTLQRLQKQEGKLKSKLWTTDSVAANQLFSTAQNKYKALEESIKQSSNVEPDRISGEYLPYIDSLKGSLLFLNDSSRLLTVPQSRQLAEALTEFKQLQYKLQQAEEVKRFIRERKQQLTEALGQFGAAQRLISNWDKEAYYYSQQIREYRAVLNDPDKLFRKSLALLNTLPQFQQFMRDHSVLAGLFSIPGNYGTAQAIIGLQTRSQVQQLIASQIGGPNPGQVFNRQVQAAQSQLDALKQKINAMGAGSGDIDMPKFKPNTQRTKTFLQRLEYGTSLQNTRSSLLFPSTTDLAFMVGYRIDDGKTFGIGLGGKLGWGKDIHHIDFTGQGLNFRGFFDIRIRSSFYASGGFEYNYQKAFAEIRELYQLSDWSKSGLIGVSKIVSLKSKVFKKTKLQLLWDFLSSLEQRTQLSQPIKFRVGYNF